MKHLRRTLQAFTLSRGEQIGSFLLLACIIILIIFNLYLSTAEPPGVPLEASEKFKQLVLKQDSLKQANRKFLYPFNPNTIDSAGLAQLAIPHYIKRNILNYRSGGGKYRKKEDLRKIYGMNDSIFDSIADYIIIDTSSNEAKSSAKKWQQKPSIKLRLFPFNPNTISKEALDSLDLPHFIKQNMLSYRNRGGSFRRKEDLQKLYGMTGKIYQRIEALIQIAPKEELAKKELTEASMTEVGFKDSLHIELNATTVEELKKLRGIGEKLSARIIKYRKLLGGYARVEQLYQVYGMPEETVQQNLSQLYCDSTIISPIQINWASARELAKHPLISDEQAQQIVKMRTKKGSFETIEKLKGSVFGEAEYDLVQFYLRP